jgi:rod shape-determining protein MreD
LSAISSRSPGRRASISDYLGFILLLGLALAQSSVGPFLIVAGVHADLVLMAVVGWTFLRGPGEGIIWALVGGLCLDLLTSGPFGLMTVALVVTSLLATLGYGRVFGGYLVLPLAFAFPLSLVYYLAYTLLLATFGRAVDWLPVLTTIILPASLLNIAAMLALFPLLRVLHRRTGREQISWR